MTNVATKALAVYEHVGTKCDKHGMMSFKSNKLPSIRIVHTRIMFNKLKFIQAKSRCVLSSFLDSTKIFPVN